MLDNNIKVANRLNFPSHKTFFGFDKTSEYYYRDSSIITFNCGSLLLALTEISAFKIYDYAGVIIDNTATFIDSQDIESLSSYGYSSFLVAYCEAFRVLSSLHTALGDLLIVPFMEPFADHHIDLALCAAQNRSPAVSLDMERIKTIINSAVFNGDTKYRNFNILGTHALLDDKELLSSTALFFFVDDLNQHLAKVFRQLRILNKSFSHLVSEILERKDDSPVLRYMRNLSEDLPNDATQETENKTSCFDSAYNHIDAINDLNKKLLKPCPSISRVIHDNSADMYDTTHGYRWINFYDSSDLINSSYAEFEFMCINNMELVKCKNCGRYFFPVSILSNFCDRLLEDGSGRTCKDIRSHWYTEMRRVSDPVTEEYVLYRKRYRSRTMRNKLKNPYERFEEWNKQAKALLKDREEGKITAEDASRILKEMDDHMKPLDKM